MNAEKIMMNVRTATKNREVSEGRFSPSYNTEVDLLRVNSAINVARNLLSNARAKNECSELESLLLGVATLLLDAEDLTNPDERRREILTKGVKKLYDELI